jgi:D-alanyl-lipoteichoic acid acyltransferase DltB (MBOAT superfamily)
LIASWIFYAWWDWRFLFLLLSLTTLNFFTGLKIDGSNSPAGRKIWMGAGVIINLGALGVFKYFNFFIGSFRDLISLFGYKFEASTTTIILPLGISFYVFLSMSYILDIYKGTLKANRNITEVLLTLSFFPIILAGPIQRPSSLLPQITAIRKFDTGSTIDGLRQILWGLFTKVVIADNLAFYTNDIFQNYSGYKGSLLLIGAVFYAVQIYADFSGYSNIAIGTAKLFGFNLMKNFSYPYFARDITEFWRRWHISLTTWFRDYIFLPLSVNVSSGISGGKVMFIKTDLFIYAVASVVTWFLTGLWHGANYTFIIWGMIHGVFLILYRWQVKPRKRLLRKLKISNDNKLLVLAETLITLTVVLVAWVFFRADDMGQALNYLSDMFSRSLFSLPVLPFSRMIFLVVTMLVILFFVVEWIGRKEPYPLAGLGMKIPGFVRWAVYYGLIIIIFFFAGSNQQFIYFQF